MFNATIYSSLAHRALLCFAMLLALWTQAAHAQPNPAANAGLAVQLEGKTTEQADFDMKQLRGRVVMLVVWRTECAVCREQMRELRDNTKGWSNKPFSLVLVSVDSRLSDLTAYNSLLSKMLPPSERLRQLWALDSSFKDNLGIKPSAPKDGRKLSDLPLFFVVDPEGKLVERHSGRLPPAVWESIAFML